MLEVFMFLTGALFLRTAEGGYYPMGVGVGSNMVQGGMGMGGAKVGMMGGGMGMMGGQGMEAGGIGAGMMTGGGAGMMTGGAGMMGGGTGMMTGGGAGMMTGGAGMMGVGAGMIGGGAGMMTGGAGMMGGGAGMMTGGAGMMTGGAGMMGGGAGMMGGGAGMMTGGAGMMGGGAGMMTGGAGMMGGIHGYGGSELGQSAYNGGNKKINDQRYGQEHGQQGGQFDQGQSGYNKGEQAIKDLKGETGYYNGANGGNNVYEDGKMYKGGQQFNKEGTTADQASAAKGHKKGHKIKSFKTSHQKQESGNDEQYYDEAHDEGGNAAFSGQAGSFGADAMAAFGGGRQDGRFGAAQAQNGGHFEKGVARGEEGGNMGRYGEGKFGGGGATFGANNGAGVNGMAGHSGFSKFFKHHPFYKTYY